LSNVGEIFAVDEHPETTELAFCEKPGNRVRSADILERVFFQSLHTRVVELDSDTTDVFTLPHSYESNRMPGRQRHIRAAAMI
jgi:hypothetical protein